MNNSTKLLVVTSFSDHSEISLYSRLVSAGMQLHMICDPTAPEYRQLQAAGIAVSTMKIRNRLDIIAALKLRKQIRAIQPDIIYAPQNKSLSVSLMASSGFPAKIMAYRGTIGHLSRFDPASWLTYLNRRVDMIVCVSDAVQKYLLTLQIPELRLTTIYKGHDLSWYKPAERSSLAEFGIPRNSFVVGFAGNIRPVKGIDVLIKSMAEISCSTRPVHLLLTGTVRDEKIRKLIMKSPAAGKIHLAGFRPDAASLMGTCDVFVMPSRAREGLPRAVIEAMAQGVPAIVTSIGGMPEIVQDNVSGLIVPPEDSLALATAISRLAENPAELRLLAENARLRISRKFNISKTMKQMMALCISLTAQKNSRKIH